jgi:hypothetical protein
VDEITIALIVHHALKAVCLRPQGPFPRAQLQVIPGFLDNTLDKRITYAARAAVHPWVNLRRKECQRRDWTTHR